MSEKPEKTLRSLTIAIVTGLSFILLIALLVSGALKTPANTGWVYDYQTLIAGLLALFIGGGNVYFIRQQVAKDEEHHRETIKFNKEQLDKTLQEDRELHKEALQRKAYSIRAQMPDALSELLSYAQGCLRYIIRTQETPPEPDRENIRIFKESLEYLDSESFEGVRELVTFYQIHNSRLASFYQGQRGWRTQGVLGDTVRLAFLLNRIFEFARFNTDTIPSGAPTFDAFMSAYRSLLDHDYEFIEGPHGERYNEMLRRYFIENWGPIE